MAGVRVMLIYLGFHILKKSIDQMLRGFPRFDGDALSICKQVVNSCWNGSFFQASNGHFNQFWVRDFSWIVDSLKSLGFELEAKKTVKNAFQLFKKQGVKTTIWHNIAFDAPKASIDSVALLLYSINKLTPKLISKNKEFIAKTVDDMFLRFVNKDDGMALSPKSGSMKDHAIRQSSCYDNSMLLLLQKILESHNIKSRLNDYNYAKIVYDNFWNGSFFEDDVRNKPHKSYVAGDANVIPIFYGLTTRSKALKSLNSVISEGLANPIPLKYCNYRCNTMRFLDYLTPGYEVASVWTHLGALFLKSCHRLKISETQDFLNRYKSIIEHYKNYLEVFESKNSLDKNSLKPFRIKPFKRLLYYSDHSMSWAAIIWELLADND